MKDDKINPKHYLDYDYQPLMFFKDMFTADEYRAFLVGQVVKYVARHRSKDGKDDLKKALFYLNLIDEVPYVDPTALSKFANQLEGRDKMIIHFLFLDLGGCTNTLKDTIKNYGNQYKKTK